MNTIYLARAYPSSTDHLVDRMSPIVEEEQRHHEMSDNSYQLDSIHCGCLDPVIESSMNFRKYVSRLFSFSSANGRIKLDDTDLDLYNKIRFAKPPLSEKEKIDIASHHNVRDATLTWLIPDASSILKDKILNNVHAGICCFEALKDQISPRQRLLMLNHTNADDQLFRRICNVYFPSLTIEATPDERLIIAAKTKNSSVLDKLAKEVPIDSRQERMIILRNEYIDINSARGLIHEATDQEMSELLNDKNLSETLVHLIAKRLGPNPSVDFFEKLINHINIGDGDLLRLAHSGKAEWRLLVAKHQKSEDFATLPYIAKTASSPDEFIALLENHNSGDRTFEKIIENPNAPQSMVKMAMTKLENLKNDK